MTDTELASQFMRTDEPIISWLSKKRVYISEGQVYPSHICEAAGYVRIYKYTYDKDG